MTEDTTRRFGHEGHLIAKDDEPGFVPAIITSEDGGQTGPACGLQGSSLRPGARRANTGRMVIVLSGARRVIVGSDVDTAALRRVLDVLERR